ncbi:rCG42626 [Rattus norvegicus]|uniref:RCG42626 n=1 Tax=Rattus norvegicus TaxID=10116 RepID=A6K162_RAT|nr:rCG42626 [Rattus norvegicus]
MDTVCTPFNTANENQNEVCDCTYMEVNRNGCVIAVGWDRRINVYFDIPRDFHHFRKPQPHWQDDLNHGHKEDILCVAQCPPFLLATSSYDGEIIVWNVISGHMYCKLNTPSPMDPREGPDRSVSRLTFLKTRLTKLDSTAASLISNGPGGSVSFWKLFSGSGLIANFTPAREKAQVSGIVVTSGDTVAYLADQHGFIYVYDIQEYGLWGAELQPPNRTFGQNRPWDVYTPDSWGHPRVPLEILTDPQSMPTHLVLETDVPAGCSGGRQEQGHMTEEKVLFETEKTHNPPSPEGPVVEVEVKADKSQWSAFSHDRLLSARRKPCWKVPELKWPSIYQALQCHELDFVSALREKPDLSVTGFDLLPVSFHSPEREVELLERKRLSPWRGFLPEC